MGLIYDLENSGRAVPFALISTFIVYTQWVLVNLFVVSPPWAATTSPGSGSLCLVLTEV